MSGSTSLQAAIATIWEASGLNAAFQAYWSVANRSLFMTLNDGEAAPGTPFPYCVFKATRPNVRQRMTLSGKQSRQIVDQPVEFVIHAKQTDTLSGKEVAGTLMVAVLKHYGGHETVEPYDLSFRALQTQYQGDWSEQEADDIWAWHIEYMVRQDLAFMA